MTYYREAVCDEFCAAVIYAYADGVDTYELREFPNGNILAYRNGNALDKWDKEHYNIDQHFKLYAGESNVKI